MTRKLARFDAKVCEAIATYVYALRDPRDGAVFYVGKGVASRCFDHIAEARDGRRRTARLDTIRAIRACGLDVEIDILRHGLDSNTASEVEASLIDVLGLIEAGNQIRGHGADRGICSADELQIRYGARELRSDEPLLLIKINRHYRPGMSPEAVCHEARWCWRMDLNRAKRARYILAVAHGIVRGVFRPLRFGHVSKAQAASQREVGRVYFDASPVLDSPYMWTSVRAFCQPNQANPIRYVNM